MNSEIGEAQRLLLMNEIGNVLPRDRWPSLAKLLTLEHRRGMRDAIASIRQFREKRGRSANSIANLFYSVPRDLELFEEYLLSEGRIPRGRRGRPRKDQEADRIICLKEEGQSWAQIARKLKKTPDACRQLVRRRLSELRAENERLKAEIERREKELKGSVG